LLILADSRWKKAKSRYGPRKSTRKEFTMVKIFKGIVHGRTIELEGDPGIEEGRRVEVVVRSTTLLGSPAGRRPDGTVTAAGMLAHLPPEVDEELAEIIQERTRGVYRDIAE
jgi:hypothetical protein